MSSKSAADEDSMPIGGPIGALHLHHLSLTRYAAIQESAPIPRITVADVRRLAAMTADVARPSDICPRKRLIAGIDRRLTAVIKERAKERVEASQAPPPRGCGRSEVFLLEALRHKVSSWSPMQCRSVIEGLGFLKARKSLPITITPASIAAILQSGRDASGWVPRRRPTPATKMPLWRRFQRLLGY